ncbi:MAG: hypothetical protein JXB32_13000 [Deltaproteobacteria bacterium]|nr:hypothetical protein [Deltaproteobacteria bacterium]
MHSENREPEGSGGRPPVARRRALVAAALLLVAPACGDDEPSGGSPSTIGTTPIATPGSAAAATERAVDQATGRAPAEAAGPGGAGDPVDNVGIRHPLLTADEFVDAPEHRDPFAPFVLPKPEGGLAATTATPELPIAPIVAHQNVIFPDIDIENLQCRMILALGGEKPRAYLIGPDGQHAYVRQGDFVGRSIRSGVNESEVHWRVYEVQEGGVSFELSSATGEEGDTGLRPALRLYTMAEMRSFENLFSLR